MPSCIRVGLVRVPCVAAFYCEFFPILPLDFCCYISFVAVKNAYIINRVETCIFECKPRICYPTISELNGLGVKAYFEIENIYISDPKAMLMLTIFASLAQNESENLSVDIK